MPYHSITLDEQCQQILKVLDDPPKTEDKNSALTKKEIQESIDTSLFTKNIDSAIRYRLRRLVRIKILKFCPLLGEMRSKKYSINPRISKKLINNWISEQAPISICKITLTNLTN